MSKLSHAKEAELSAFIGQFYDDPLGFVMGVWPWGQPTLPDGLPNPLAERSGPEEWQREELIQMGGHIRNNVVLTSMGLHPEVYRSVTASGHGVGKSALVTWLIYFLMSTRKNTRMAVTAATQAQLEDRTWPELAKWHRLALNRHWFEWSATALTFAAYPVEEKKNYRATAATVSEHNTEAFAGLHNQTGTVGVIFDEASGVNPKVWEVAEGAFTDGEGFFFAFGNPTRAEGEFADCFDKHSHIYKTRQVDSRTISFTNKSQLDTIIAKYGADSDEARVRVYGQFPSQSFNGFILRDGVREAQKRELRSDIGAGLIMAVDVARFGGDKSVIAFRQGRDARSIRPLKFKQLSTVQLADICVKEVNAKRPDAVVIESTGPGAGVIDQLRARGVRVHEIHPGSAAAAHQHYVNKRAECWGRMRDWIYEEGCLSDDPELEEQLCTILYNLDRHEQRIQLEAKDAMKRRGLPSPDEADTLALTFGVNVARRDRNNVFRAVPNDFAMSAYDPLGDF